MALYCRSVCLHYHGNVFLMDSDILIAPSCMRYVVIHHLESRCHCSVGELVTAYLRDHTTELKLLHIPILCPLFLILVPLFLFF